MDNEGYKQESKSSSDSGGILSNDSDLDDLVFQLVDFENFHLTLKQDEFMLPSDLLAKNKIEIHFWKNIPLPVVNASKQFESCF